ncbi:hypothetical protein K8I31_04285 [bacterium]|nr:hypothetical protein [bacterium]
MSNMKLNTVEFMSTKNLHRILPIIAVTFVLILSPHSAFAKSSYVSYIPNGTVFSCNNCHGSGFTPFGNDFRSNGKRWSASLASKDSDGDGVTNGDELQDSSGSWARGNANPGDSSLVTNPGDKNSVPAVIDPTSTPVVIDNTPTPVPANNTPTPSPTMRTTEPTATPAPVVNQSIDGTWSASNEDQTWLLVFSAGSVTGSVESITSDDGSDDDNFSGYEDDDDDEEDDDDDDDEHHGGSDEHHMSMMHQIHGSYMLMESGTGMTINLTINTVNDDPEENETWNLTGMVHSDFSEMELTGFLGEDMVSISLHHQIPDSTPTPHAEEPHPTTTPKPDVEVHPTPTIPMHHEEHDGLIHRFTFDNENEYSPMHGGYQPNTPHGSVLHTMIPHGGDDYTDGQGVMMLVESGQVELIQLDPVQTDGKLILLRASIMASASGANIAFGMLNGDIDGSIQLNLEYNSEKYMGEYHTVVMLYQPTSDAVIPIIQIANPESNSSVAVYVDNVEIYSIPEEGNIPVSLLYGD